MREILLLTLENFAYTRVNTVDVLRCEKCKYIFNYCVTYINIFILHIYEGETVIVPFNSFFF